MNKHSEFVKWVMMFCVFIYAGLLIPTCACVWNAAAGTKPDTFYIVCSIIHFVLDIVFAGWAFNKVRKSLEGTDKKN